MDLFKRSLELGLGALILTKEAADKLFDELTGEGGMERDQARQMVDDLVERGKRLREDLAEAVRREVEAALHRGGLATQKDYEALLERVAVLEQKLHTGAEADRRFEAAPGL